MLLLVGSMSPATINKKIKRYLSIAVFSAFFASTAAAQTVTITNTPRPFSAKTPAKWVLQPLKSGNVKLDFQSPRGTPQAGCTVVVQTLTGLRGHSQDEFNAEMTKPLDIKGFASSLSVTLSNVRVISAGYGALSRLPTQIYKVQYSTGTPSGKIWSLGVISTTISVPDIIWTVGCTGQGRTTAEAQKAFDYWQLELVAFPTFIKFL